MEGEAGAGWLETLFLSVPGSEFPAGLKIRLWSPVPEPRLTLCATEKLEILHGIEGSLNVSKYSEMAAEETKNFITKI